MRYLFSGCWGRRWEAMDQVQPNTMDSVGPQWEHCNFLPCLTMCETYQPSRTPGYDRSSRCSGMDRGWGIVSIMNKNKVKVRLFSFYTHVNCKKPGEQDKVIIYQSLICRIFFRKHAYVFVFCSIPQHWNVTSSGDSYSLSYRYVDAR